MHRVRTDGTVRRRLAAVMLVALGVWLSAPYAEAQGPSAVAAPGTSADALPLAGQNQLREPAGRAAGVEQGPIHKSIETLRFDVAPIDSMSRIGNAADQATRAEAQRGYRGRRGRGDRGVAGLVLGAIGGFVAGGAIGVAVAEHSCTCEDPALHGFIIGAPIGAVIGGFIGYAVAR